MLLSVFGVIVRFIEEIPAIWKILIFLACLAGGIWLIMQGVKKCYNPKKANNVKWVLFVFGVVLFIVGLAFVIPIGQLIS